MELAKPMNILTWLVVLFLLFVLWKLTDFEFAVIFALSLIYAKLCNRL